MAPQPGEPNQINHLDKNAAGSPGAGFFMCTLYAHRLASAGHDHLPYIGDECPERSRHSFCRCACSRRDHCCGRQTNRAGVFPSELGDRQMDVALIALAVLRRVVFRNPVGASILLSAGYLTLKERPRCGAGVRPGPLSLSLSVPSRNAKSSYGEKLASSVGHRTDGKSDQESRFARGVRGNGNWGHRFRRRSDLAGVALGTNAPGCIAPKPQPGVGGPGLAVGRGRFLINGLDQVGMNKQTPTPPR